MARFVYADGPAPADHNGNTGAMVADPDFTHIDVDFSTQEVLGLQLKLDVAGVTYHAHDSEFTLFDDPNVVQDMSFSISLLMASLCIW
ncbi:hypothetical protein [Candidatus Reidiella endopervernicosa]|uniref:Uncharacterized protein n=1 Tax=Candidatus Reidiella endopervernicosa TaxID=2738883 RepID=A0A6N0HZ25_9GAMM|nr:hypothetical protein [Candidatus Reidiella endopervernicosa]QKQ27640.1 hypothetical protein HUE57_16085 [Candidatus Reidiella endopervernicosa]